MIKKTLFVVAGLLLVGGILFGRELSSYMRTGAGWARQSVKNSVPLDFEINRARDMIRNLEPEIAKSMHTIAKEEAALEQMQKEIANRQAALDKGRLQLTRLQSDLAKGGSEFTYAGRNYTAQQVRSDLTARFANYKTREATVTNLNQIVRARQSGLDAARQKLTEMHAAKRQLEVDVEDLEARLKMVEVAQTANANFNFDDSHLARTRELVTDLNARLDVMSKLANAERTGGEIPLEEPNADTIVDDVAKYFGQDGSKVADVKVADVK